MTVSIEHMYIPVDIKRSQCQSLLCWYGLSHLSVSMCYLRGSFLKQQLKVDSSILKKFLNPLLSCILSSLSKWLYASGEGRLSIHCFTHIPRFRFFSCRFFNTKAISTAAAAFFGATLLPKMLPSVGCMSPRNVVSNIY